MNVSNVGRLLYGPHTLLKMRKFIMKGNPMNVGNVERPFFMVQNLISIRKFIPVRDHMNVKSVEKPIEFTTYTTSENTYC